MSTRENVYCAFFLNIAYDIASIAAYNILGMTYEFKFP